MEALGIDSKLLLAQLINFAVFTFVFVKFMYKPFRRYLQKNLHEEQEREKLLADLQKKDEKLQEREKKVLADAHAKASKIIQDAADQAKVKADGIVQAAEEEAHALKLKTQKDLTDEREKLYDEVKQQVVKTSEMMTAAVLKDVLTAKQQKDITENVRDSLKKSHVYEN